MKTHKKKDTGKFYPIPRNFRMNVKTDVIINDSVPTRQLRLLSRKNNIWRIAYVQGGFGKHYVYAECKIINDSISDFKISQTNLRLENNDSIDKYLADKKLEPKKVKIIMK